MAVKMGQVKGKKYPVRQPVATKKCTGCGEVLPLECFAMNATDRGRHSACRKCEEVCG